ncbi:MAG: hypothetical protein ACXIUQ_20240 [Cecembia sp.]
MPQFIDAIAYSLWSWDMAYGSKGQIPLSYMKDLAWGGMTSYKDENGIIRYYDSFKERFPNSNDRYRIERNIKNESDGNWSAKGKKCSWGKIHYFLSFDKHHPVWRMAVQIRQKT